MTTFWNYPRTYTEANKIFIYELLTRQEESLPPSANIVSFILSS